MNDELNEDKNDDDTKSILEILFDLWFMIVISICAIVVLTGIAVLVYLLAVIF